MNVLILVAVNWIMYWRTILYGYCSDDEMVFANPVKPKGWLEIFLTHFHGTNYKHAKLAHTMRLVMHTINVLLIYTAFGQNNISFMGALLFSLNPANLQGAIWLSGTGYQYTFFFVLSMWCLKAFPLVGYWGALHVGLTGVFAPLLFLYSDYKWWILLLVPAYLFIKRRHLIPSWVSAKKSGMTKPMSEVSLRKLVIGVKTFGYYLQFCLWPRRVGMYHNFLYSFGLRPEDDVKWYKMDKQFFFGLFCLAFCAFIILKIPLLSFYMFWYCLFIGQWSNFTIMPQQPFAERYCYLPNAGLMMLVATVLHYVNPIFTAVFITYYTTRSWMQLGAYKDDNHWLDYNVYDINFPEQFFVYTIQGVNADAREHRPFKALEKWDSGRRYRPNDERINFFIANMLAGLGFLREALHHIEIAEKFPVHVPVTGSIASAVPMLKKIILENIAKRSAAVAAGAPSGIAMTISENPSVPSAQATPEVVASVK